MADIGVLDLRIESHDTKAINNLGKLVDALGNLKDKVSGASANGLKETADALSKIKSAVSGGMQLSSVATGLTKLASAVKEISGADVAKIREVGESLSSLQGIGTININIRNSGVERVTTELEQARESIEGLRTGFENIESSASRATAEFASFQQSSGVDALNSKLETTAETLEHISGLMAALFRISQYSGMGSDMGWMGMQPMMLGAGSQMMRLMGQNVPLASDSRYNWKPGFTMMSDMEYMARYVFPMMAQMADAFGMFRNEGNLRLGAGQEPLRLYGEVGQGVQDWLQNAIDFNRPYAERYGSLPGRSMEDWFQGLYWMRNGDGTFSQYKQENDLVSGWLQGGGSEKAQMQALGLFAQQFGLSIDEAKQKINEMRTALQGAAGDAEQLSESMGGISGGGSGGQFSTFIQNFKDSIKSLDIPLAGLVKQFARIAKYRMLRAVIKQITDGFKEGVENVYRYSQETGSAFAPAMDSIASVMAQFKNSIGAAVAPVLTAIIPVLNAITSAAINAVNALNQLFSLLGGRTSWTRAVPQTTTAFNDIKKSAGGAGGAVKELLADFDELNVIASQGGGGGGGGGAGGLEDFANMFEDMFSFDKGIRDFVNWLKSNLESIKGIAIAIGTAIAAWKLANAFMETIPWLAKLFGLIATGAVIAITLQVNWLLTNRYFDTKDPGWLIADALTTAVGATIAAAMAQKIWGGHAGAYTAVITLTLSAITGVVALLKRTDVSALSKEGLLVALENALKFGAAGAILLKTVGGATLGTAIKGGAAVALTTFGFIVALKATLDPNIEFMSLEYIATEVISAAGVGLGVAILSGNPVIGAGAAIATFLANISVKALLEGVDATALSKEGVLEAIVGGLDGAALVGAGIYGAGLSTSMAIGGAAGAGLFTFGLVVGIKAIADTVDCGEITKDTIKANLLSAGTIGAGLAIAEAVFGGTAATIVGVGAGGAVLTLAALFAIEAIIAGQPRAVRWGNERWTAEQIQNWVDNHMIKSIEYKARFDVYTKAAAFAEGEKEKLEDQVNGLLPEVNSLIAGIDTEASIANINTMVFGAGGLVDQFNSTIEGQKAEIKAAITLVPITGEEGQDLSADFFKTSSEGWGFLSGIMEELGKSLSDQLAESEKENLDAATRDMISHNIATLTQAMMEVSSAVAHGQYITELNNSFQKGLDDIVNADKATINELMTYYESQIDGVRDGAKQAYQSFYDDINAQIEANKILMQKAVENGGEFQGTSVAEFEAQIKALEETYKMVLESEQRSIEAATNYYTNGEGKQKLRDAILKMLDIEISESDITTAFAGPQEMIEFAINNLFDENGIEYDGATDRLNGIFDNIIKSVVGVDNYDTIKGLIDSGILSVGDFISDETIQALAKAIGIPDTGPMRDAWNKLVTAVMGESSGAIGKVKEGLAKLGVETQGVLDDWHLVAPIIETNGIEDSVDIIERIVTQCGPDTQTILENWNLFAPEVSGLPLQESLTAIQLLSQQSGIDIKTLIEHWNLIAPLIDKNNIDQSCKDITQLINTNRGWWVATLAMRMMTGNIVTPSDFGQSALAQVRSIASQIQSALNTHSNATVDVVFKYINGATELFNLGSSIIKYAYGNISVRAAGGMVPSGELFIANENGPELVGTIGGQTGVANQGQIIQGISQGVAEANEEQNGLLREQNSLLRQILQKDASVRLGASAAFGRVAKQSLEMYGKTTGG